jgi:hypothetical protein
MIYVTGADHSSALIAVQAGVERRDMAVVTSFRKYVYLQCSHFAANRNSFVRNLGGTLGLAIAGTIM